ncbi:hypothetical protein [Paractinoplanes brasiliensis]|uniref:hypothetical protein n=1 Tax=Paractinoplanes brasiliensis TaxID=52695 RepID=UPI00105FF7C3|nr:hypothetical protein [Actinoplanes brasiliensis]
MTPSADLSPPRRPIFFPVVIATVFLTIIAMTGGFVLGERQRGNDRSTGGGVATLGPSDETSASPAFDPPGDWCPQETRLTSERTGGTSELWQVLKIYASDDVYWICQDRDGGLYYQGKTGGRDAPLIEGENGLFLTGVVRVGEDSYRVEDQKGNIFEVSTKRFRLIRASGKVETASAEVAG